jgi:hypothetical protein
MSNVLHYVYFLFMLFQCGDHFTYNEGLDGS